MEATEKVDAIAGEIKTLSLHEKTELKSVLDKLLLEDRKQLLYSNYHETIRELSKIGPSPASDIEIIRGEDYES